jgi:hypothetical protein
VTSSRDNLSRGSTTIREPKGMRIMRPVRTVAAVLLLSALALTGCRTSQADEPTASATRPPDSTAGAAPTTPADTTRTTAAPSPGPTTRDPVCAGAGSWGIGPKQALAPPVAAEIYQVRAAGHQACDRLVFDLNGLGRVGYVARYVPAVHADPSDRPIPVAGAAALQITIGAPDFRESGHQPGRTPWQLGQRLVGGQGAVREVRFAGTFEHVTTFAVGVSTRRPFRVLVLPDNADHITHLVVDVAH